MLGGQSDGEVLGYSVVNNSSENPFVWLVIVAERFPPTRRRLRLLRHTLARFPDRKVFTSTNESNWPSRQLIESVGFERAGQIDHLDEGDSELVYVRLPAPDSPVLN